MHNDDPRYYAYFTVHPAICVRNNTYFIPYYINDWFTQKAPQLSDVCITPPTMPVQGKIECHHNSNGGLQLLTNWGNFYVNNAYDPDIRLIIFS